VVTLPLPLEPGPYPHIETVSLAQGFHRILHQEPRLLRHFGPRNDETKNPPNLGVASGASQPEGLDCAAPDFLHRVVLNSFLRC
jgi:hypothetical protein